MNPIDNLRLIGAAIDDDDKHPQMHRQQNLELIVQAMLNCMTDNQLENIRIEFELNNPKRGR